MAAHIGSLIGASGTRFTRSCLRVGDGGAQPVDGRVQCAFLDDAERLGISQPTVGMLAHRGTLEHLARGVCRFVDLPVSPASPNLAVVLWTGQPRACPSHDTALNELCDINPGRIHVTVPKGRRIRCKSGRLRGDLALRAIQESQPCFVSRYQGERSTR